jgi:hypothetical protein
MSEALPDIGQMMQIIGGLNLPSSLIKKIAFSQGGGRGMGMIAKRFIPTLSADDPQAILFGAVLYSAMTSEKPEEREKARNLIAVLLFGQRMYSGNTLSLPDTGDPNDPDPPPPPPPPNRTDCDPGFHVEYYGGQPVCVPDGMSIPRGSGPNIPGFA